MFTIVTNNTSTKQFLYYDTDYDLVSPRREMQSLTLFYKILNGIDPSHIFNLLETYLVNNQRHYFRSNSIQNAL